MRIAVFHNVPAGGAKRVVYEMTKGLAEKGHTLIEVAPSTAELEWCSLVPYTDSCKTWPLKWPVWQRRVPFLTPYLHLAANALGVLRYHLLSKKMARWLQTQSFDVLFASDCSTVLNPPIAGYASIPTLLYIQHGSHLSCHSVDSNADVDTPIPIQEKAKGLYYKPATMLWDVLRYGSERWVARHTGAIACNSTVAQRLIRQAYGTESQIVHLGVDSNVFHPTSENGKGDYVLSVGAITRHKSFGFLVESLAMIPHQLRPRLLIASAHTQPDEVASLTGLAQNHGVGVEIVQPQSDQQLVRLYNEARAFLFAAHREAFGMVVIEAMACGTPVVGIEDGGYTDSIIDEVTGFVTPRTPEVFGEAVVRLLERPGLRDYMGQRAREHVLSYWTWDRAVDDLEKCLYTAINGHLPASQKQPGLPS